MGLTSSSVIVEPELGLEAATDEQAVVETIAKVEEVDKTVSGGAIFSLLGPKLQLAQWKQALGDIEERHILTEKDELNSFQFDYETKVSYITLVTTLKPVVQTWLDIVCSGEEGISKEKFWKRFFYCLQQRLDKYTSVISLYQSTAVPPTPTVDIGVQASVNKTFQNTLISMLQAKCSTCEHQILLNTDIIQNLHDDVELHKTLKTVWNALEQNLPLTEVLLSQYNELIHLHRDNTALPSTSTHSTCHQHSGKWIKSQNSTEFASFPPDQQENLRQGKQKRMNDIMKELQWIPDTDHVKDTVGKWSCCELTEYNTEGCEKLPTSHQYIVIKR